MTSAASKQYRYRSDGEEHGPVTAEALMELFATHMITAFDEVQVEGETQWLAAQTVVGGLLESRAGAAAAGPTASPSTARSSAAASTATSGAPPSAQALVIPQRGAPAPKPEGSISDEELALSISYAREQVKRARRIRMSVLAVLFLAFVVTGVRFSANLHAASPPLDAVFRVDTRVTLEAADASLSSAGGVAGGVGTYSLRRVRDVTYNSDGSVRVAVHDEPVRWHADFEKAPDYNEVKKSVLRDREISFAGGVAGSVPALSGSAPSNMSPLKLVSVAFDNTALYPDQRMWPWPWQVWSVAEPHACSVFALDLESCKGEVRLKFRGFASCNGGRCARIAFDGEWEGVTESDAVKLTLTGEIIRSLSEGVDLSVAGTGTLSVERAVTGGTSIATANMTGAVTYAQTTSLAH